jgi:hypothetical protein
MEQGLSDGIVMRITESAGIATQPCGLCGAQGQNELIVTRKSGPRWLSRLGRDLEERRYIVCADCSARTPVGPPVGTFSATREELNNPPST